MFATSFPKYERLFTTAEVASVVTTLEAHGIAEYRVQSPSIEDVFLRVSDEMRDNHEDSYNPLSIKAKPEEMGNARPGVIDRGHHRQNQPHVDLSNGRSIGFLRQMWILLRKRVTILRSNYIPYWSALIIPIVAAGMVTLFFKGFQYPNGIPCPTNAQLVLATPITLENTVGVNPSQVLTGFVYGPPGLLSIGLIRQLAPKAVHLAGNIPLPPSVSSESAFKQFVRSHQSTLTLGGFFFGSNRPILAWNGNAGVGAISTSTAASITDAALLQNFANSVMIQRRIHLTYESFSNAYFQPSSTRTLQLIIYAGLAFCAYPALFALYPCRERLAKVRALHFSNGIRSVPLWSAYIAFDFFFIVVISVVACAIWSLQYTGWYYLGVVFLVFLLFGLASTSLSYVVSLFATSQLATFAFTVGLQCGYMMIYYIR